MGIRLHDGSRIGVVGGGPAGSLFAYFLLTFARRMDLNLCLDIYEPRDFTQTGPDGCNMCGGIVSESLVQALAVEGIGLPSSVVQRGIDSYVLCTAGNRVRIDTPSKEKRIAAVHRGGGPRDLREVKWGGLDGYLLTRARELGAVVVPARVSDVGWDNGRPQVHLQNTSYTYRTAKAAARTAIFSGVSAHDFRRHYWPLYRSIAGDNRFGRLIFAIIHRIKAIEPLRRGVMRMAALEQAGPAGDRPMSIVLWDLFTGSAPYREVFFLTLAPR